MKKILFTLIISVLSLAASAADTSAQATKVLDNVASRINVSQGVTMNFAATGHRGGMSGTISVKGAKFHLNTPTATIWCDGRTQWALNKKADEVNISSATSSKQATVNPCAFLYLYKQGYSKSMQTVSGGYSIHLIGKGKAISEMYVIVDRKYNVKQVKVRQSSGWTTISVSRIKNTRLSDSLFKFDAKKHPQAEIIDLR